MNYLDLIIYIGMIFYLWDGYRRGFLHIFMELIVFMVSILAAFLSSNFVGSLLTDHAGIPKNMGPAFGFIVVWFVSQLILSLTKGYVNFSLPEKIEFSIYNKIAGVLTSFVRGAVFIGLIMLFVIVMPVSASIKDVVNNSAIGSLMVGRGGYFDGLVKKTFGNSADNMVTFLTINPFRKDAPGKNRILESNEEIKLGYKTTDTKADNASESRMFELVNNERAQVGLPKLVYNEKLQILARKHGKDMFQRGYFSHVTPDKVDPFTRMSDAGIDYLTAGENLALAPTVDLAHNGLMNSLGHRANILEPRFGRVGIGVIDGGVYGKMFVQEFKD